MSVFAIADLHLAHTMNKPMDIFGPRWENHTQRLRQNWLETVSDGDTVVIAGDISWAMDIKDALEDFSFLHSLPGEKLLMKGNHDYWWSTRNKADTFFAQHGLSTLHILHNCAYRVGDRALCGTRGWLYNSESEEDRKIVLREAGRLQASIDEAKKLGGKLTAFLHYPPLYDGAECREILDILEENEVEECYFGHIHGQYAAKKALAGEYHGIKMQLISADFVNFCPILIP